VSTGQAFGLNCSREPPTATVKRVEIPKPDGGVRKLGVPCVADRLIQQALLQVLQEQWDPTFSGHSYGFRPGRSAHQVVAQAQCYVAAGYSVVVDLDLEKFFDRVNHDSLRAREALLERPDNAGRAIAGCRAPDRAAGSQAEVPLVGLVEGHALSGQIDRLVVEKNRVLVVDFKTLRPPPATKAEVPPLYLRQLALYRAALGRIYPGREIRCALLWTEGPRLMPISPERLAGYPA